MHRRSLGERLADVRGTSDIHSCVQQLAESAGFGTFLVAYVNPQESEQAHFIDNYPGTGLGIADVAERDPLVKHVRSNPTTLIWNPDIYHQSGTSDIWEAGRAIGFHSGISCPIRPGGGRRMLIALTRDTAHDTTPGYVESIARQLEFTTHALAGTVLTLFDDRARFDPLLLPVERDCLRWVFNGLSTHEIARKVKKSTFATEGFLTSAACKLESPNPIMAAMIAARLGILGEL